jgi:hypothetical protein
MTVIRHVVLQMLCAVGFLAASVTPSSSQILICNNTQATLEVAYVSGEVMVGWQEVPPHVGCALLGDPEPLEAKEIGYHLEILARPKRSKKVVEVESVTNGSIEDGFTWRCVRDQQLDQTLDRDSLGQDCEKPWYLMKFQQIAFERTQSYFEIAYGKK